MTGVVLAAGAMFAVGLIDDVRDMSAPAKMAGQVLAASILYFSGVTMYELKIPLAGFFVLTPGIVPLITAAWVIALTNAVNLIDGLDGLAAGVVAIGGGALAIYGIRLQGLGLLPNDNIGPLVAVVGLRHLPRLPALQLQPGAHLHGRCRRALPRPADGGLDDGDRRPRADRRAHQRRHLLLLRPPLHPAPHPRGPAGRHGVRLRAAHGQGDRASTPRTRSTSTTGCSVSATAPGAASSSCGPGRRSCPASSSSPCSCTRSTPSSRSGPPPSGSASTPSSTRACAGGTGRTRKMGRSWEFRPILGSRSGSARWSGSRPDRLDGIWAQMR